MSGPLDGRVALVTGVSRSIGIAPAPRPPAPRDDVANLVAFLCRDEGAWIVGQVINSEGDFRR